MELLLFRTVGSGKSYTPACDCPTAPAALSIGSRLKTPDAPAVKREAEEDLGLARLGHGASPTATRSRKSPGPGRGCSSGQSLELWVDRSAVEPWRSLPNDNARCVRHGKENLVQWLLDVK